MKGATFISHRGEFESLNDKFVEMALALMAMDIEVYIKVTAGTPVKTGDMKAEVRHFRSDSGKYRVESPKEYSGVQEAGRRAGSRPFTNYTTPGTSGGWFKRAIETANRNKENTMREAAASVGLR